jgi:CheY-like chemotaxis protein
MEEHALADVLPERKEASRPLLRVLLAEDSEVNVKVVTRMLDRCGCIVDVAENGIQAISLAATGAYAFVLMDIQMPHCDGLEAARSIRLAEARDGRERLPIYAVTANAMSDDRLGCIEAGMDGFLPKPIPLATLRSLVDHMRNLRGLLGSDVVDPGR